MENKNQSGKKESWKWDSQRQNEVLRDWGEVQVYFNKLPGYPITPFPLSEKAEYVEQYQI